LVGDTFTEADVRLFTTLVRFDPVYHGHFKCNRSKLSEMPVLWAYARDQHPRARALPAGRPLGRPPPARDHAPARPTRSSTQAYSKATSFHFSYRPLTPPWPALISVLSSNCASPVLVALSLATHLAGST
ncbi:glutathione S-transferase C-terminal domain-containing protein, partial [Nocardia brasiliensis]|uniref:glutathione S-transferase C-terminal domain-containing protein n=1 Tax=Nocardia brasiliensis TaxID=37326 RepID=UPI003D78E91E